MERVNELVKKNQVLVGVLIALGVAFAFVFMRPRSIYYGREGFQMQQDPSKQTQVFTSEHCPIIQKAIDSYRVMTDEYSKEGETEISKITKKALQTFESNYKHLDCDSYMEKLKKGEVMLGQSPVTA